MDPIELSISELRFLHEYTDRYGQFAHDAAYLDPRFMQNNNGNPFFSNLETFIEESVTSIRGYTVDEEDTNLLDYEQYEGYSGPLPLLKPTMTFKDTLLDRLAHIDTNYAQESGNRIIYLAWLNAIDDAFQFWQNYLEGSKSDNPFIDYPATPFDSGIFAMYKSKWIRTFFDYQVPGSQTITPFVIRLKLPQMYYWQDKDLIIYGSPFSVEGDVMTNLNTILKIKSICQLADKNSLTLLKRYTESLRTPEIMLDQLAGVPNRNVRITQLEPVFNRDKAFFHRKKQKGFKSSDSWDRLKQLLAISVKLNDRKNSN